MTHSPTVRESLSFVAAASRPGSIEARKVYGCTCTEDRDRERVWNPDDVASWQPRISLDCPAHGRLLEQYIEHVNQTLGRSAEQARAAIEQAVVEHEIAKVTHVRRRSLIARIEDTWRGAWAGWRGV